MPHGKKLYIKSTCIAEVRNAAGQRSTLRRTGAEIEAGTVPTHGTVGGGVGVQAARQAAHQSALTLVQQAAGLANLTIRDHGFEDSQFTRG